jgi:hypothetical protein
VSFFAGALFGIGLAVFAAGTVARARRAPEVVIVELKQSQRGRVARWLLGGE